MVGQLFKTAKLAALGAVTVEAAKFGYRLGAMVAEPALEKAQDALDSAKKRISRT